MLVRASVKDPVECDMHDINELEHLKRPGVAVPDALRVLGKV